MAAGGDAGSDGGADRLGTDYEAGLSPAVRRARGAHYTPAGLADRLVAVVLDGAGDRPVVCDPACGGGAFLLAAGRRLAAAGLSREEVARHHLWGADIDPQAVATTAAAIEAWAGTAPAPGHLLVADTLAASPAGWDARFAAVVGNPPFLNQLESATARSATDRRSLRRRFGAMAGGYADSAWLFLLAALDLIRPGGRLLLIQPQSLLAADHAGSIRHALLERADLAGIWWCDELIFSANVRVCAPLLRRHTGGSPNRDDRAVDRWEGPSVETRPPVPPPSPSPARRRGSPSTWAHLVAQGSLPDVDLVGDAGTLGDLATATAGFRDQYYGLAPFVIDCLDGDDRHFPKLITSGLVDPGRSRWGERPARFAGRTWLAPRVDRRALAAEAPRLSAWVEARLVPKVVLATQTRVLEPAVDPAGVWIPSVPVIAVHAEEADLWRVAAVLLAPAASVWALATFRGAALGSQAIKLSARQVLHVPLPADRAAWSAAAETLQAGGPDRIHRVAGLMNEAYGAATEVLSWWQARLPKPAGTALG